MFVVSKNRGAKGQNGLLQKNAVRMFPHMAPDVPDFRKSRFQRRVRRFTIKQGGVVSEHMKNVESDTQMRSSIAGGDRSGDEGRPVAQ